jgi:hypothetical protein
MPRSLSGKYVRRVWKSTVVFEGVERKNDSDILTISSGNLGSTGGGEGRAESSVGGKMYYR